jgi:hypothetical protein
MSSKQLFQNTSAQVVTPEELDLIILHLLRSDIVIQSAFYTLEPDLFNRPNEIPHHVIWSVVREFYREHKVLPSEPFVISEVSKKLKEKPEYAESVDKIIELMTWVFKDVTDNMLVPSAVSNIIQRFLDHRVVLASTAVPSDANSLDISKFISGVINSYSATRISVSKDHKIFDEDVFDEASAINSSVSTIPSGCHVFDRLTNGGLRAQHLCGILAPYGGGKTMLSIDVAVNTAKQREHVFFFQYELPFETKLRPRIWSCASGISSKILSDTKPKDLPADIKEKLRATASYNEYLHVKDMTTPTEGINGMLELDSILCRAEDAGIKPRLVILDWLGFAVLKYCNAHNLNLKENMYSVYREMCGQARQLIADKHKCEFIITHQLNGTGGNIKGKGKATVYDASEFKQFAALMDTCLLMTKTDIKTGLARIYTDKNRGLASDIRVRNLGDVCKFEIVDDVVGAMGNRLDVNKLQGLPKAKNPLDRINEISAGLRKQAGALNAQ